MTRRGLLLLTAVALLAGCAAPTAAPTAIPTPSSTAAAVLPQPTGSPTLEPLRLVLCSVEPRTFSPFIPTQAGRDILGLFYEDPVEYVNYRWEPRLLEQLPSLENGAAFTRTVSVPPGATYADSAGALLTNDGAATLDLPQLVVTFTLKADLRWSDGEPLTTDDVILSYHLAQEPESTGRWAELVARTARLEAVDDRTVRWEGVPGYLSTDFPSFLFPPQPAHRWQGLRLSQVLQDRQPPGTGPFTIVSWEIGKQAVLAPNPYYAGAPPLLEGLVVRFPDVSLAAWPQLLTTGECDVVLPDPAMNIDRQQWAGLALQSQAVLWANAAPTFLRLDFNSAPPEELGATPLQNRDVRLALSMCIDRVELTTALAGASLMPAETFLPPGHPAYAGAALPRVTFDPAAAQTLLDTLGWRDEDGDGVREAHSVPEIANGAPLSLSLYLAPWYTVPAAYLLADWERCGVKVTARPMDVRYLYAPDPAAPLAGRAFDMVFYGWQSEPASACGAWRASRIPGSENHWEGENFSGYASATYDAACARALAALDAATQTEALQAAQVQLADDLPTFFLTWRPYWFVARPEVQGLRPFAELPALWNAEEISVTR